jgi:hypothetical protein
MTPVSQGRVAPPREAEAKRRPRRRWLEEREDGVRWMGEDDEDDLRGEKQCEGDAVERGLGDAEEEGGHR